MKTKADRLLHPVLTVILKIKIFFTTIAVVARVVKIFQKLDTTMMVDWFEIFLTVVAIYGAWLMLQTKKFGFYLVTIPNLITGIISLFYLPYMAKGVWMSFGQIAFIMLLMLLRKDGKNAYQVLWGKANVAVENDEESLTTELNEEPEETPRNPQERGLWQRIKAAPEDTMEQVHDKLGLVNTYVDNYSDGLEIDEAKSLYKYLVEKLRRMEKERREEEEDWWRLDKDDYFVMRDFMQKYPNSVHKNELDDFMWRYTVNNMSPEQFKRYCDDWGNDGGKHIREVQRCFWAFDKWNRINWHDIFELKHFIDQYPDFAQYPNFVPAFIQFDKLRDKILRDVRTNCFGDIAYLRRLVNEGVVSKEEIRDCCVKNYVKKLEKTGNALGNNKTIFLEQVRMKERNQVLAGIMTQETFIQKLIELLGYYTDLELEDYRGWIEEDTYDKLIDAVFLRFLEV